MDSFTGLGCQRPLLCCIPSTCYHPAKASGLAGLAGDHVSGSQLPTWPGTYTFHIRSPAVHPSVSRAESKQTSADPTHPSYPSIPSIPVPLAATATATATAAVLPSPLSLPLPRNQTRHPPSTTPLRPAPPLGTRGPTPRLGLGRGAHGSGAVRGPRAHPPSSAVFQPVQLVLLGLQRGLAKRKLRLQDLVLADDDLRAGVFVEGCEFGSLARGGGGESCGLGFEGGDAGLEGGRGGGGDAVLFLCVLEGGFGGGLGGEGFVAGEGGGFEVDVEAGDEGVFLGVGEREGECALGVEVGARGTGFGGFGVELRAQLVAAVGSGFEGEGEFRLLVRERADLLRACFVLRLLLVPHDVLLAVFFAQLDQLGFFVGEGGLESGDDGC